MSLMIDDRNADAFLDPLVNVSTLYWSGTVRDACLLLNHAAVTTLASASSLTKQHHAV